MSKRINLEWVAYHEAGHAVVAVILGRRLAHATIEPNQEAGSLGHVHRGRHPARAAHANMIQNPIPGDQERRRDRYVEREVMLCLAGVVAEAKVRGGRHNWVGASSDWHTAIDYAWYMCNQNEEELDLFLKWMLARTKNLLEKWWHWKAVEYVAKDLLERKTIPAKRIRELFKQARIDLERKGMGPRRTMTVVVNGKEETVRIGVE